MKRIIIIAIIASLWSCRGAVNSVSRPLMGTMVTVTFISDPEDAPATGEAVFSQIARVEALMSPYDRESDVSGINSGSGSGPVAVSQETYDLVARSMRISSETGGSFDITFAAVAPLWNYKDKNFVPPSPAAVAALLPLVGSDKIRLYPDTRAVSFARPGMKIGLGAIAKGYAVEQGIGALGKRGVESGIVEAGGDLQVMGSKYGKPWITGLRDPRRDAILLTMMLEDGDAIATSGDYERFVMRNGVRYHHIIDPRTGYPASGFCSVSVLSKSASLSDAYATAIFVMGPERAREFLGRHAEIGVVLVDLKENLAISKRLKDRVTLLEQRTVEWL
jgi:FAD:protein FMN transferase